MDSWRIFNDGVRVLVSINGRMPKAIPWQRADEIAKALMGNARICEENGNADKIIHDAAILARTGLPIGLTNNPKMQEEARKESMHNREIRRSNLPDIGSIPSQEVFGTPAVSRSPSLEQLRKHHERD
jgi:hypothetical protein